MNFLGATVRFGLRSRRPERAIPRWSLDLFTADARPAVVAQREAIRDGALDGTEALTADLARPAGQHGGDASLSLELSPDEMCVIGRNGSCSRGTARRLHALERLPLHSARRDPTASRRLTTRTTSLAIQDKRWRASQSETSVTVKPHPDCSLCEPSQTHSLEGDPDYLLGRPQPVEARHLERLDVGSATVVATSARGGRPLRAFSLPIVSGGDFGADDLPCHASG